MKNDLTTQKGRMEALNFIEKTFIDELRRNSFDVSDDAECRINSSCIELGIKSKEKGWKIAFASEITLYASNTTSVMGSRDNEINFGSSGAFSPIRLESYWRTVHAASILKNWGVSCEIVNKYCKMYSDLEREIFYQKEPIVKP